MHYLIRLEDDQGKRVCETPKSSAIFVNFIPSEALMKQDPPFQDGSLRS